MENGHILPKWKENTPILLCWKVSKKLLEKGKKVEKVLGGKLTWFYLRPKT